MKYLSMSLNTGSTDWLWQAAIYITLGVVITTIGSAVASVFTLAFEVAGAILSLFIITGSVLVGIYYFLRGLAIFLGELAAGKRIES